MVFFKCDDERRTLKQSRIIVDEIDDVLCAFECVMPTFFLLFEE